VGFAPGSFEVGMRLPESEQRELFKDGGFEELAHKAFNEFLYVAEWASSFNISLKALENRFAEPIKRRVVLKAIKPFIPRHYGGIDLIELSGSAMPERKSIKLTHESIERISSAFESSISKNEEKYEGEIREIDLDKKTFKLRKIPEIGEISCRFREDIMKIAVRLLGKKVSVIGIIPKSKGLTVGPLNVIDLELSK
jgi:predicted RNA-binding protein